MSERRRAKYRDKRVAVQLLSTLYFQFNYHFAHAHVHSATHSHADERVEWTHNGELLIATFLSRLVYGRNGSQWSFAVCARMRVNYEYLGEMMMSAEAAYRRERKKKIGFATRPINRSKSIGRSIDPSIERSAKCVRASGKKTKKLKKNE